MTNTVGDTKTHTLGAANYSEVFTEVASVGKQTEFLVFQSPDRIGGYQQSGNKRTYVYVIGKVAYESLTVSAKASTAHLTFYRQPLPAGETAKSFDPAHIYLPYARQVKPNDVQNRGGTYSFTIDKSGQIGHFVYTVSGPYVSEFTLKVGAESVALSISEVGSSPPVALPAGAKVVAAPSSAARPPAVPAPPAAFRSRRPRWRGRWPAARPGHWPRGRPPGSASGRPRSGGHRPRPGRRPRRIDPPGDPHRPR